MWTTYSRCAFAPRFPLVDKDPQNDMFIPVYVRCCRGASYSQRRVEIALDLAERRLLKGGFSLHWSLRPRTSVCF